MDKVTKLYYEIASAQAQLSYGKSEQLHRFALHYGLESSTSLSTEGVLSWVSDKVKQLGHFMTIKVNEACAAITGASDAVKKRIAKAKKDGPDHDVKLPLSGADILRISAGIVMLTAAVAGIAKMESRRKEALDKHRKLIDDLHAERLRRTAATRTFAHRMAAREQSSRWTDPTIKTSYRSLSDMHMNTAERRHSMVMLKMSTGHPISSVLADLHKLEETLKSAENYARKGNASPAEIRAIAQKADLTKRYAEELRRKM